MGILISLEALGEEIKATTHGHSCVVVAMSGFGGSGKSSTAEKLATLLGDASIIHVDDFLVGRVPVRSPDMVDFDWDRLTKEVLLPIREGKKCVEYGMYNWGKDIIEEKRNVALQKYVIIEGVGLLMKERMHFFDYAVWIDVPPDVAMLRGKKRDKEVYGVDHDRLWNEFWALNDEEYFEKHRPEALARYILQNV